MSCRVVLECRNFTERASAREVGLPVELGRLRVGETTGRVELAGDRGCAAGAAMILELEHATGPPMSGVRRQADGSASLIGSSEAIRRVRERSSAPRSMLAPHRANPPVSDG